jgi:hypothetical protein
MQMAVTEFENLSIQIESKIRLEIARMQSSLSYHEKLAPDNNSISSKLLNIESKYESLFECTQSPLVELIRS